MEGREGRLPIPGRDYVKVDCEDVHLGVWHGCVAFRFSVYIVGQVEGRTLSCQHFLMFTNIVCRFFHSALSYYGDELNVQYILS